MKRLVLFLFIFLFFTAGAIFSVEVSERQDIAIFGLTYYSYDIPGDVLGYADSSINYVFIKMKRFNVLGYGKYRIESNDIDDFVKRIREIQSEKAREAGTYDEKFGTVVIKGEDFDKIVNSFLVVIPSLSSYSVSIKKTEYTSGSTTYVVDSYVADIVIDITFVDIRKGSQEESIRISGSGTDENLERANKEAVDNAISGLTYNIKRVDAFKIKSGVISVRGDTVYFELGKNLGVKPGDEYEVMTKQEIGRTGKIVQLPTGLIRVKKVYPDVTEARIVFQKEKITEGDQLVEVAQFGAQLSFYTGVMKIDIPDMNYGFILGDDFEFPPFTSSYYISLNQGMKKYVPIVGLSIEKSLGYRFKGIFDATGILNFPLMGGIGELGVGAVFYKRRFSFQLSALGGLFYMTTFKKDLKQNSIFNELIIKGKTIEFDKEPVLNIYGVSVGVKGGLGINYRIKRNAALRAAVKYRLYTPIKDWKIHIEETAGSPMESVTIDSDSRNIDKTEESEGMKKVNISGYEINLSFALWF